MKLLLVLLFSYPIFCIASPVLNHQFSTPVPQLFGHRITGPLNGIMGIKVPHKRLLLIYKVSKTEKDTLFSGSQEVKTNYQNYDYSNINHILAVRYGLTPRVELKVVGNFYDRSFTFSKMMQKRAKNGKIKTKQILFNEQTQNLGDSLVFAKYQILSPRFHNPLFLSTAIGLKLPTGKYDLKTQAGKYLPWNMQTSTGSTDIITEVAFTKKYPSLRLDAGVKYFYRTKGKRGFQQGDTYLVSVSSTYQINKYFDLGIGSLYKDAKYNYLNGLQIDNSGGTFLYLSPSLGINISSRYQLSFSSSFVVNKHVNGVNSAEDLTLEGKLLFFL